MELINATELEKMEIERVDFPGDIVADLHKIAQQLMEEVKERKALGIAAPQVGIPKKMAIVRLQGEEGDALVPVVNPQYFPAGARRQYIEGCLSYGDQDFQVKRYKTIKVRCFVFEEEEEKIRLRPAEFKLSGRDALVLQHETDHCNGITLAHKGKKISQ